ncbi:dipeptide transport system permease protein DppB [bacterium BMS3Bbin01]|nr:dipeptide transport system permease protein DppB [bacterium BMS3Bbin01]
MLKFIGKRTVQNVLVFFVFLTATFFVLQAQPGDISDQFLSNPKIPQAARQQYAERLGLTGSTWDQYVRYMRNFATGNLGVSFSEYPREVSDILKERIPRTVALFIFATLLSFWMGFKSGKILAWRRGKRGENLITITGVFFQTVFYPWFALLMIRTFSFDLKLFPGGKFLTVEKWLDKPDTFDANSVFNRMLITATVLGIALVVTEILGRKMHNRIVGRRLIWASRILFIGAAVVWWLTVWSEMLPYALDIGDHLILPTITLSLIGFGGTMLLTRASMLETLREDYILTARAKGLPSRTIRDKHAARNALLPVTTSLVIGLAFLIGGGVITETVFSWPGMGRTLLTAALTEDIPLVLGAFVFIAVLALLAHMIVDILYMYLDPRIRVGE